MIALTYACSCGWRSPVLDDAQEHADETTHIVQVRGTITARELVSKRNIGIDERARLKARELEIMRRARAMGVVK